MNKHRLSKYYFFQLVFFLLWACFPIIATSTNRDDMMKCGEIAFRISCHAFKGACSKNITDEEFQTRTKLESMISYLCTDSHKDFSKYFWIDVHGEYQPYYSDKNGNSVKYPPK